MISYASIDYFSFEGIRFILIALLNIWIFQPFVSTLHELGHKPALFLTRGKVKIRDARGGKGIFLSSLQFRRAFQFRD